MFTDLLDSLPGRSSDPSPVTPGPHARWRPTSTHLGWWPRLRAWRARRRLGPLVRLAVAVALTAVVLLDGEAPVEIGAVVEVPLAARDLPAGSIIDASDLTMHRLPADHGVTLAASDAVVGAVLSGGVRSGEPILSSHLVDGHLVDGERAIRLPSHLDAPSVLPGDRVDVLGVRLSEFGTLERTRLVDDARVLEAGDDESGPVVIVPLGDDLTIASWLATGTISLVARP